MINISFELQQIEQDIFNQTGEYTYSQLKVDYLRASIDSALADAVGRYINMAVDEAEDLHAYDFAELVDVVEVHDGIFEITTVTGQTDFSEPEIQMLPHLLRNGKTSKDGVVYKTIPIKDGPTVSSRSTSIFDVLRERQELLDNRRSEILSKKAHLGQTIAAVRAGLRGNKAGPRYENQVQQGDTNFVTATSRQDQTTQWVRPKKDKDMTSYLADLNYQMRTELENIIRDEIDSFKIEESI